eukprot:TRINITY_DN11411_c0_g1_i1.p3 TRINITY_DN11411_c0_g1~~TRINITY_DN11411_c0_g1_i1.p3  ORF type:complete len:114 (-),score=21.12 TRINITY_DN11411_c0_g1_i1:26-367(-)
MRLLERRLENALGRSLRRQQRCGKRNCQTLSTAVDNHRRSARAVRSGRAPLRGAGRTQLTLSTADTSSSSSTAQQAPTASVGVEQRRRSSGRPVSSSALCSGATASSEERPGG